MCSIVTISLHGIDVDHLHAALLNDRAGDGDDVAHTVGEQRLRGLMILQSSGDVQSAFVVDNCDRLPAFAHAVAQSFFAAPRSPPSR